MKKIKAALQAIRSTHGVRKTNEINQREKKAWGCIQKNMESMTVDIDSAPFEINPRYTLQSVQIPEKKRGNLSRYAGKKVVLFTTTVARSGARINFYIKEAK